MPLQRFLEWYPQHRSTLESKRLKKIYDFLSRPDNLWAMVQESEEKRPALNGVVRELEKEFGDSVDFHNPLVRRMVGGMIKEILNDFGYRRKGQKMVSHSEFFSTASYYIFEEDKALKKITGQFGIEGEEETEKTTSNSLSEQEPFLEKELFKIIEIIDNEDLPYGRRKNAVFKMGALGSLMKEGVSTLISLLDKEPIELARQSSQILVRYAKDIQGNTIAEDRIKSKLCHLLRAENKERRLLGASSLKDIGRPGSNEMVEDLAEALKDEDFEVRREVARALCSIGHPAYKTAQPYIIEALEDVDEEVRIIVAEFMGICAPESVKDLIGLLGHPESHVRKRAVIALGIAGSFAEIERSGPALLKILKDENEELRISATWAIGSIGETAEGIIETLCEASIEENSELREKATWAFGMIGNKEKIPVKTVIDRLEDSEWFVRRTAAWALGHGGVGYEKDPIPDLIKALKDKEERVREQAAWALGNFSPKHFEISVAVEGLTEALKDESWRVRKQAVVSIGRIGKPAMMISKELFKILRDNKEKAEVRDAARRSISLVGAPES